MLVTPRETGYADLSVSRRLADPLRTRARSLNFALIVSLALAVSLAPILTDADYLVYAFVPAGLAVYVHGSYFREIREAVSERELDYKKKGIDLKSREGQLAYQPKMSLDFARLSYIAAAVLAVTQVAIDSAFNLFRGFPIFFILSVVACFVGIVESNRVMNASDNHFYNARFDIAQYFVDLFALVGSIQNLRILISSLPEFHQVNVFSAGYVIVSILSLMAAPFLVTQFRPIPNKTWAKVVIVFVAPFIYVLFAYLLYSRLPR